MQISDAVFDQHRPQRNARLPIRQHSTSKIARQRATPTHVHGSLDFLVAVHAAVPKVPDRAGIDSALLSLELGNQLHGTHFGRAAYRA